jgi:uncharacterized protein YvpB
MAPKRLFDTRDGTGGHYGALGPGEHADVQVAGVGPIPLGAKAAVLNVTAVAPAAAGFLTVYPAGQSWPLASNVNYAAGQTAPNLAIVGIGAGGKVSIINSSPSTHVLVDAQGWYWATGGSEGLYRALSPARILDTRDGTGGAPAWITAGQILDVQVTGRGNIPASGVSAVAINVTAVNPTANGYVTAYPTGAGIPNASNLNIAAGQVTANRVIVQVGSGGRVSLYNCCGQLQLVVDINGWYTDGGVATSGGEYAFLNPARLLDTRDGTGGFQGVLSHGQGLDLAVLGRGGVPGSGVSAVAINTTVTGPAFGGFATVYSSDNWPMRASDLNFATGQTTANLTLVRVGADGHIKIVNAGGAAHFIVDVSGYYATQPSLGATPGTPGGVTATSGVRSVTINWQLPNPGGSSITSVTVASSPNVGYALAGPTDTTATFTNLQSDVTYTFSVAATNAAGTGSPATTAAVRPIPPDANVIYDVPWIRQQYSLSCEAASIQMALAHEGISITQDQALSDMGADLRAAYRDGNGTLRWGNPNTSFVGNVRGSEINLTGYGVYAPVVARVATARGASVVRSGSGIPAGDVYTAVLNNHPVIVWTTFDWNTPARQDYLSFDNVWILYAGPEEHTVVVVGVSGGSVLVNDPDRNQYWVSKGTFEAAYSVYGAMAVEIW